jgi:NADH-quinone oxidoreductase subunit N
MTVVATPGFLSAMVLVIGALLILTFTTWLTGNSAALTAIGTVTLLLAIGPALGAPSPALVAVSAVIAAGIVGMLLVPSSELHETTQRPEAAALILLGSAGAMVMATAADLLTALIGLETLSLSVAVLVALGRGERPLEAAFKYFVLAAISVSLTIYGLGLLFLTTGSFAWPTLNTVQPTGLWLWMLGVLLVILGIAYKMAVFPLHWGPLDAYTAGAPGLVGYVMAASKIGAVLAIGRLVSEAAAPMPMLVAVGLVSIVWGTFGALAQREMRRMLAYSTILNAGFMALALGSGADGRAAAIFYVVIYALTALLIFAALAGRGTGLLPFADFTADAFGPLRAMALGLGLLSLAGIPPTPGFWAKLAVLDASWQALGFWPTLVAALGGVAGVLYYLRPLPDLWTAVRSGAAPALPGSRAAVLLAGLVVVVLGLAPGAFYALARLAAGG